MCPRGGRLVGGSGGPFTAGTLVAHCLLVEASDGLVLVDTGLGTADVASPERLGRPMRAASRPRCRESETALRQIERLGLDPRDVRHLVLTHLDVDHAGGLGDFPAAQVHVFAPELAAALQPSLRERERYVPAQWAHGPLWAEHELQGDNWFGFESVRLLPGLDVEIAMVPLLGHSAGHAGIAVNTPEGWLLHCGDAYFHHGEMATPPSCPPALRLFQIVIARDRRLRRENLKRLRQLAARRSAEVRLICSHDPAYLNGQAAQTASG